MALHNWRTGESLKMRLITLYVAERDLDMLDEFVRAGLYPNRSEAVRLAIRDLRKLHTRK